MRKGEIVGKPDPAVKIFATTFGAKMDHFAVFLKLMGVHVLMVMVPQTMLA